MDRRALTRLRLAFLLLGAALLVPLGLLLRSVDARLEAQRRLRHELVAERIFDEMEGELTALLAREDARPSAAYAATSTRVENWAPFVVGYFTRDARGVQIVAKPQLEAARVNRLEATLRRAAARADLEQAGGLGGFPPSEDGVADVKAEERAKAATPQEQIELEELEEPSPDSEEPQDKADEYRVQESKRRAFSKGLAPAAAPAQKVQAAPEAVLKQLNRAADSRKREAPSSKSKAKVTRDDNDPLSGLE